MKKISFANIFILLLGFHGAAGAQYYKSKPLFTYPGAQAQYSNELASVGNKIVTYYDGAQGPGFYSYDITNGVLERLIPIKKKFIVGPFIFRKFYPTPNGVLVDALGRLYFSDGTVAGTKYLGNLGQSYTRGSLGVGLSRMSGIQMTGNSIYFTQSDDPDNFDDSPNYRIVRVDKNLGSSTLLSDVDTQNLKLIPNSAEGSSAIAFGYDENKGFSFWRASTTSDKLEFITRFAGGIERSLSINSAVTTRAGLLFCRFEQLDPTTQPLGATSLWRLSIDGQLTRLADDCIRNLIGPDNNDGFTYFTTETALWQTTGSTVGLRKILEVDSANGESIFRVCKVKNEIFVEAYEEKKYEADRVIVFNTESQKMKSLDGVGLGSPSCLSNSVLLFDNDINAIDNTLKSVHQSGETLTQVSGSLPFIANSVEVDKRIFAETRVRSIFLDGDYYEVPSRLIELIYKDGVFMGYLPAILELLSEESETPP